MRALRLPGGRSLSDHSPVALLRIRIDGGFVPMAVARDFSVPLLELSAVEGAAISAIFAGRGRVSTRAADVHRYTFTLVEGARRRSRTFDDTTLPPTLRTVVERARS